MTALEHVVRSFARRASINGDVSLITNGHPALVAAFKELGWSDPYVDPELLPVPAKLYVPLTLTNPDGTTHKILGELDGKALAATVAKGKR